DVCGSALHCILERVANNLRNVGIRRGHHVCDHQLIRKHTGLPDLRRVAQSIRNELSHSRFTKNALTRESVEVHTSHLPRRTSRNLDPFRSSQLQCSQHLKRNVRNLTAIARSSLLKVLEDADNVRQCLNVVVTTDEVTKQCFTVWILRLRVDHLQDVCQRRILTNVGLEQGYGK